MQSVFQFIKITSTNRYDDGFTVVFFKQNHLELPPLIRLFETNYKTRPHHPAAKAYRDSMQTRLLNTHAHEQAKFFLSDHKINHQTPRSQI